MAKQKLNQQQIGGAVYAHGSIGSGATAGNRTLTEQGNSGNITKTDGTTYTVQVKGVYFIHFQQLIDTGASAVYFEVRINGATQRYGYLVGNVMMDANVSEVVELNVGDTIRCYLSANVDNSWSGAHSNYQIYMLKRTD